MAFERRWSSVPARPLTSDGGTFGEISITSTKGFRVKQNVILKANTLPDLLLEVKKVLSPTQLLLGKLKTKIKDTNVDLSAYTVALNATLEAPEQDKVNVTKQDQDTATYEQEPVVARRVISVDEFGDFYNESNPIPVKLPKRLAPNEFDEIEIQRDIEDDPVRYDFKLNNTNVGSIEVTYNINKSAVRYKKV